ncbi:hypothetical protein JCM3774_004406 [Rhodotorula dairenensis]
MASSLRPVQRLLHTTRTHPARLIGSHLSLSPDFANAPPPPAPVVPLARPEPSRLSRSGPRSEVQASAVTASTVSSPSRPPRPSSSGATDDGRPTISTSPQDRTADQLRGKPAAQETPEDLVSATALETHLLRTLVLLEEKRRRLPTPGAEVGLGAETSGDDVSRSAWLDLPALAQQKREREGRVVDGLTVDYEPTPGPSRRLRLDGRTGVQQEPAAVVHDAPEEQDGIVIVAHVLGGVHPRVSICSGFAVGTPDHAAVAGEGQVILTCAHTLDSIEQHLSLADATAPSATLVLTQSGHVYTASSLLSSVTEADLLLLRLSPDPINPSALPLRRLRSLPINPYPAPVSTAVSVHRYLNPLSRLRRKLQKLPEREWEEGTVREYKDPIGRTAEPGTYDALHSMWLSCAPTSGSSGGPVIDRATGSVIGVTRGSTHKYGERQQYGFATPSERIFEMFRLPGFKTTADREAERLASSTPAPADGSSGSAASSGSTRKA